MTRESLGRGRPIEHEETRNTILRVAQELFMEYGYRAVSTRQIADACGLTQPALYHHFTDKQQLYAAMAREELAKTGAALERISRRHESVKDRLLQAARYLLSHSRHDHSQMLHDIRNELDEERRASLHQAFRAGIIQPLNAIFADGLRDGTLKTPADGGVDPASALFLFMSMIAQFLHHRHGEDLAITDGRAVSASDAAALIVQVMLHGIAR